MRKRAVTSAQAFGGGPLGVWAEEVGRELNPNVGPLRKVIKIKDKEIFIFCYNVHVSYILICVSYILIKNLLRIKE